MRRTAEEDAGICGTPGFHQGLCTPFAVSSSRKRKAVEIFKAHAGVANLPFTDKQVGQIYDRFKNRFGF